MRLAIIICLFISAASAACADECYEPVRPACITDRASFSTSQSFGRCNLELNAYRDAVMDYHACVSAWVQQELDRADKAVDLGISLKTESLMRLNRAFAYWNCMATGEPGCQKP